MLQITQSTKKLFNFADEIISVDCISDNEHKFINNQGKQKKMTRVKYTYKGKIQTSIVPVAALIDKIKAKENKNGLKN